MTVLICTLSHTRPTYYFFVPVTGGFYKMLRSHKVEKPVAVLMTSLLW